MAGSSPSNKMAEEAPIAPSVYLVLCLGGFLGGVTKVCFAFVADRSGMDCVKACP